MMTMRISSRSFLTIFILLAITILLLPPTTSALKFRLPANHHDPSAPPKNPNPPTPEFVKERNERRFPGVWFPEGYDVGEPAKTGSASSEVLWKSPLAHASQQEKRIWYDPDRPEYRPPGKLLLNMLVMNEEDHLRRTLPHWKHVIDYWIIGVDEKNTDDSIDIIKRELGHLPGMIALVKGFDGHGPTWTTLVTLGVEHFPGATHGIISDADFRPMQTTLDRRELDIRCSKHMYTIFSSDHRNERRMDWIYRNIPGARINRRTHQVVEVPTLPEQEVFQTLANFAVDEQPGGYGDRNGNKEKKYIAWMTADLQDFPDDPRALYYLGYGNLDLFHSNNKAAGETKTDKHWAALDESIHYFTRRINLPEGVGNTEERWFATMKLGEIYERYKNDWKKAEEMYTSCIKQDKERADPYFYVGQHYRLVQQPLIAEPYLYTASTLTMPQRSLFQWHFLYECLAKLEYVRNWGLMAEKEQHATKGLTIKLTKRALSIINTSNCASETSDPGNAEEMRDWKKKVQEKLQQLRKRRDEKKKEMEEKRKRKEMEKEKEKENGKKSDDEVKQGVPAQPASVLSSSSISTSEPASSPSLTTPTSATSPRPPRPLSFDPVTIPLRDLRSLVKTDTTEKLGLVQSLLKELMKVLETIEEKLRECVGDAEKEQKNESVLTLYTQLVERSQEMSQYLEKYPKKLDDTITSVTTTSSTTPKLKPKRALLLAQYDYLSCRSYRLVTSKYLELEKKKRNEIERASEMEQDTQRREEWRKATEAAHALCR